MGSIVQTRNVFLENLSIRSSNLDNTNLNMLPEYEKNVYAEYLG